MGQGLILNHGGSGAGVGYSNTLSAKQLRDGTKKINITQQINGKVNMLVGYFYADNSMKPSNAKMYITVDGAEVELTNANGQIQVIGSEIKEDRFTIIWVNSTTYKDKNITSARMVSTTTYYNAGGELVTYLP